MTRGNVLVSKTIFLNTAISCENILLLVTSIFFFGTLHLFIQFTQWKPIEMISIDLSIFHNKQWRKVVRNKLRQKFGY